MSEEAKFLLMSLVDKMACMAMEEYNLRWLMGKSYNYCLDDFTLILLMSIKMKILTQNALT